MFYLFSMETDPLTVSVYTKGKKKVLESELMFGYHLYKGYQLFYEKGFQISTHELLQNIPRKPHSTDN